MLQEPKPLFTLLNTPVTAEPSADRVVRQAGFLTGGRVILFGLWRVRRWRRYG